MTFNDLKNVALWDLTAHRGEYKKLGMGFLMFYGFLLLIHIFPQIWQLVTMGSGYISVEMFHMEDIAHTAMLFGLSFLLYILKMGSMFYMLQTKQGRINEFMLPADNSTRMTWRVIATVVGTALVMLVGIVCYDLVQMFIHWVAFRNYPVESVFSMVNLMSDVTAQFQRMLDDQPLFWFFFNMVYVLGIITFGSTYALGSAIKYRHSILWTTLFHFVMGILSMTVMVFIAVSMHDSGLMESLVNWFIEHIDSFEWIKDYPWVFPGFVCLIELCICLLLWRWTYKLYKKAQLTTRLNP